MEQRQDYFDHVVRQPTDTDGLRARKKSLLLGRADGMRIYKYCSVDIAQKIFESGSILLQAPDRFNDPFDCLARVDVWARESRFAPEQADIEYALSLMRDFPPEYQLANYEIFHDMRTSYCFAITCFGERYDNHLMWSHYANNHRGVCLAFDANAFLDDVHPCAYFHSMPRLNWTSGNIALPLIKGSAWAYEEEWRLVKKTIRPKMRVIGSITHQIYNAVHSNPEFSVTEYEEWGQLNKDLHKRLEDMYNEERRVSITPSRIYLGLNFTYNYTNTITAEKCDAIRKAAEGAKIPVSRMAATQTSFDMVAADVSDAVEWKTSL